MGLQFPLSFLEGNNHIIDTMKAIAAALTGLVAAVSAEAEPWLAAAPLGLAHPAVAAIPAVVPINPHATRGPYLGLGLGHVGIWKREAEAEAEPWLGYNYGLAAPAVGLAYGAPLCVNGAWGHGLCKREAEAEPWLGYGLGVPAVGLPVAPLVAHP